MFSGQSNYASPGSSRQPRLYSSMGKGVADTTTTASKTGELAPSGEGFDPLGALGEGFEQVAREGPLLALNELIRGGSEEPSGAEGPDYTYREGPVGLPPSGPSPLLILGLLGIGGVGIYLIATR